RRVSISAFENGPTVRLQMPKFMLLFSASCREIGSGPDRIAENRFANEPKECCKLMITNHIRAGVDWLSTAMSSVSVTSQNSKTGNKKRVTGVFWVLNRFGGGGPRYAANPGLTPSFRRRLPETGCLSQGFPHGKRYAWPCPQNR